MQGLYKVKYILYTHFYQKLKMVKGIVLYVESSYIWVNGIYGVFNGAQYLRLHIIKS